MKRALIVFAMLVAATPAAAEELQIAEPIAPEPRVISEQGTSPLHYRLSPRIVLPTIRISPGLHVRIPTGNITAKAAFALDLYGGVTIRFDADLHWHVHVVSSDELRPVLGDKTEATINRGRIVRVGVQSNILPIDNLELRGSFVTDAGRTAALAADWSTLAWITNEKLPPNRVEQTYATGENILKGGAAILTAGLSLLFTNFRPGNVEVQAPYSEFLRMAPHASALHNTTATASCTAIGSADGAGRKCTWYFVVDNISRTPVSLDVETSYVSMRQTGKRSPDVEERCIVKRPVRLRLGKPEELEKVSRDLFGAKMQPVRSMVRSD